jgi:serine O-acetyltransferase
MKLDAIKAALLASYETDGGINHLDGVNLPSQESVNEISRECMHLLFPGFFEESRLEKKDMPELVELALMRIGGRLEVEIEKSLRFAQATPTRAPRRAS